MENFKMNTVLDYHCHFNLNQKIEYRYHQRALQLKTKQQNKGYESPLNTTHDWLKNLTSLLEIINLSNKNSVIKKLYARVTQFVKTMFSAWVKIIICLKSASNFWKINWALDQAKMISSCYLHELKKRGGITKSSLLQLGMYPKVSWRNKSKDLSLLTTKISNLSKRRTNFRKINWCKIKNSQINYCKTFR